MFYHVLQFCSLSFSYIKLSDLLLGLQLALLSLILKTSEYYTVAFKTVTSTTHFLDCYVAKMTCALLYVIDCTILYSLYYIFFKDIFVRHLCRRDTYADDFA